MAEKIDIFTLACAAFDEKYPPINIIPVEEISIFDLDLSSVDPAFGTFELTSDFGQAAQFISFDATTKELKIEPN